MPAKTFRGLPQARHRLVRYSLSTATVWMLLLDARPKSSGRGRGRPNHRSGLLGLYLTDLPCPILTTTPSLMRPLSIDTAPDLLRPSSLPISSRVNSLLPSRNAITSTSPFRFLAGRVIVKEEPPVSMAGCTACPS